MDVAHVAPKVALGALFHTGQVCCAIKRVYVHEDIYYQFMNAIVQAIAAMSVGDAGPEATWSLGPIQNSMQYEKVKGFIEDSVANDHKLALGSGIIAETKGYFLRPIVVDNPPEDSRLVVEEQFGKYKQDQYDWRTVTD